ncbi:MAG TPA: hypothetical protein VGL79_05905 [Solirubrobacteraceae bacterium]|jgi:hypothetical protein
MTTVIACLALFFALGGTAIAAQHYLITSTSQIKPSVLAKLKGDAGATGAQGSTGSTGPAGPAGATGSEGPAGPQGKTGFTGPQGPAGAIGVPGKMGERGPEGPAGGGSGTLSTLKEVEGPKKRVPAYNEVGTGGEEGIEASVATCPSGEHAVSGGSNIFGAAVFAIASIRSKDDSSWIVAVANDSTFNKGFVQATAYCATSGEAVAASVPGAAHAWAMAEAKKVMARLQARVRVARAEGWKPS